MSKQPLEPRLLPFILSIPHAGHGIPAEVRQNLAIDEVDVYNDCDLWADLHYDFRHIDLADLAPAGTVTGALATVTMPIARVLIDANRRPDDLDNPDGPVKTQTSYGKTIYREPLTQVEKLQLLDHYWRPFHRRLHSVLASHAGQVKLFLDCHNMAQHGPSAYADPGAVRPLICIANLGDARGEPLDAEGRTTCPPWLAQAAADIANDFFHDLRLVEPVAGEHAPVVAINQPFRGGYIIDTYTKEGHWANLLQPGVDSFPPLALMIEVNRGLFVGNQDAGTAVHPPNLARIAEVRKRLYRWAIQLGNLL